MPSQWLVSILLATGIMTAACAPRNTTEILSPPAVEPSGAPSAVPLPLPTYPYDPGLWV